MLLELGADAPGRAGGSTCRRRSGRAAAARSRRPRAGTRRGAGRGCRRRRRCGCRRPRRRGARGCRAPRARASTTWCVGPLSSRATMRDAAGVVLEPGVVEAVGLWRLVCASLEVPRRRQQDARWRRGNRSRSGRQDATAHCAISGRLWKGGARGHGPGRRRERSRSVGGPVRRTRARAPLPALDAAALVAAVPALAGGGLRGPVAAALPGPQLTLDDALAVARAAADEARTRPRRGRHHAAPTRSRRPRRCATLPARRRGRRSS